MRGKLLDARLLGSLLTDPEYGLRRQPPQLDQAAQLFRLLA
jgi:hypothetical protein